MNRRIPFVENELKPVGFTPGFFGGPDSPILDFPVSPKENVNAMYFDKHPYWMSFMGDSGFFWLDLYNTNLGRGGWNEGTTDCFGIEWEYVEMAQGAMVRPGEPFLENANEWKDKIIIPDLDSWDWEAAVEQTKVDKFYFTQMSFPNGFCFERLISFMDFGPAAIALIDDDQKPALHELFGAMAELGCKLVDKFLEHWPGLDGFNIHDDWGSQKAPFFSEAVAREMILPYFKILNDHIHSKGRVATLHSCGHVEDRVNVFIDAGFDQWTPQAMNNTHKLYDEVGDKIVIAVIPDEFDPETTPEAEQRQRARDYVDRFCQPKKPANADFYSAWAFTPAFRDEVYSYSRKKLLSF